MHSTEELLPGRRRVPENLIWHLLAKARIYANMSLSLSLSLYLSLSLSLSLP